MTTTLEAFHGDQAVKDKYLALVQHHRELDNLVQGQGWDGGRGCAIGCTLEKYDHSRYPEELGLPVWLAYLEDHIFEALPPDEAKEWPAAFLEAIQPGVPEAVFTGLRDRFQIFWLERQKTQIDTAKYPDVANAIQQVIGLLQSALGGVEPESAARSAAESAARSEARVKRDWLLTELKSLKP